MLTDPAALAWFKPGFVNVDTEFPNPLLGVETEQDRAAWPDLPMAAKCAMRWRGSVRQMARLRAKLAAGQLITLRYEEMIRQPAAAASAVSDFLGTAVSPLELPVAPSPVPGRPPASEPGAWRRTLSPVQAAEIEGIAGDELRRVGYGS
jgi:hypothetical protein